VSWWAKKLTGASGFQVSFGKDWTMKDHARTACLGSCYGKYRKPFRRIVKLLDPHHPLDTVGSACRLRFCRDKLLVFDLFDFWLGFFLLVRLDILSTSEPSCRSVAPHSLGHGILNPGLGSQILRSVLRTWPFVLDDRRLPTSGSP
jgi:hypothetical protein